MNARKVSEFRFADDGLIPNHPTWPLLLYGGAVDLLRRATEAAMHVVISRR